MTQPSYKEAYAELEQIVARMQAPDCDIDLLSQYTSRALELLKICKAKLTQTDAEVKRCIEELSAPVRQSE